MRWSASRLPARHTTPLVDILTTFLALSRNRRRSVSIVEYAEHFTDLTCEARAPNPPEQLLVPASPTTQDVSCPIPLISCTLLVATDSDGDLRHLNPHFFASCALPFRPVHGRRCLPVHKRVLPTALFFDVCVSNPRFNTPATSLAQHRSRSFDSGTLRIRAHPHPVIINSYV